MMQFVLLLLIAGSVVYGAVPNSFVLADFQQQALIEHNLKRQLHCTGAMKLNSTLNTIAQTYADYLAKNDLFQHSGAAGLGENLWSMWSSASINYVNGSTPTNSWYSEISSYNYGAPGYSSSTGHFTQVIWKGSLQLGIGIAFTSNSQTVKVVANYFPAGNVIGSFPSNVLPRCSTTGTTSRTTTTTTPRKTTTTTRRKTTTTTTRKMTTTTTKRRNKRFIIKN